MTRYPKGGKGRKFTAVELKNIPALWKGDKLSEEGLQGEVRVSSEGVVSVRWLTSYRHEGKQSWYYCGTTPQASMEDVRAQMVWCREQVREGINPDSRKRLDRIEKQAAIDAAIAEATRQKAREVPLREMAEDWLTRGVKRADGNVDLRRILEKDVFPTLGDWPVRLISEKQLGEVIQAVAARGAHRMAVIIHGMLGQMYAWCNKREPWRGLLHEGQKGNPMEIVEVKPLLPSDYDMDNIRDRVLSDVEIRLLKNTLEANWTAWRKAPNKRSMPQPLEKSSEHALWLCLSTLCRIGELSMAEWKHVNFVDRTWFIPKDNTKGKHSDLWVYLSDFSLRHFEALKELAGDSPWVFPSINDRQQHRDIRTVTKQVGDRQARFKTGGKLKGRAYNDSLVLGEEAWTPHDLRRTGATLMQSLGVSIEVIDRCQNHVIAGSKVRRHYLHHEYREEKTAAWAKLGLRIEAILQETPRLSLAA